MDSNCPPVRMTRLIPYVILGLTLKLSLWAWLFFKNWTPAEISDYSFEVSWMLAPWLCVFFIRPLPNISWQALRMGVFLWTLSYVSLALTFDSPILLTHHFSPKLLSFPLLVHLLCQLLAIIPAWLCLEAFSSRRKRWYAQLAALDMLGWCLSLSGDAYYPTLASYFVLRRFHTEAASMLMGVQLAASLLGSQPIWGRKVLGFFTQYASCPSWAHLSLSGIFLLLFALVDMRQKQRKLPDKKHPLAKIPLNRPQHPEGKALT